MAGRLFEAQLLGALVDSMVRRFEAVITTDSGYTKYWVGAYGKHGSNIYIYINISINI